jgi:NCAIR mutase (PurE)-related protein
LSNPHESHGDALLDFERRQRIGISEAIFCDRKRAVQIDAILQAFHQRGEPCLLTRLRADTVAQLAPHHRARMDYDPISMTGISPGPLPRQKTPTLAIVSGGTSDAPVCLEAARTLLFHGHRADLFQDLGVTGLWRLQSRIDRIRAYPLVIAVAGMEGALFSVLGGLYGGPMIAVPTSVGYGVAAEGQLALHAALSSCAPGLLAVNVDNGYGAACAAIRLLGALNPR